MENAQQFVRKPNPRKTANWFSILTFGFIIPILKEGYKNDLNEDDIREHLEEHDAQVLGDRLEQAWLRELAKRKKPWLMRPVLRVFGREFVCLGFIALLIECVLKPVQPLALSQLIRYYSGDQVTKSEALRYACLIVGAAFLNVCFVHTYMCHMQVLGMKMRVALCALIYRKTLRLSKNAFSSTGEIVNLISNDVNRCDRIIFYIHWVWITPLVTIIVGYTLYWLLGFPSIIGIIFMCCFIPFEMGLGKLAGWLRLKTALKSDERIRYMNEIISGIQVIKMYTWENSFRKLIREVRKREIRCISWHYYIKAVIYSFTLFGARTSTFLSIMVHVLRDEQLTAIFAFTLMAFYNVLSKLITLHFPEGIMDLAEFNATMTRMTKFLLYEEFRPLKPEETSKGLTQIVFNQVCAKWILNSKQNTLNKINMEINKNQLIAIIGPVGSGKTSILNVILNELPITSGVLKVNGRVSYATQEAWVFAGSVRQNILFGQPMNENRYKQVVNVCALKSDFVQFPYGDETIVGERGVTLSGGQRARINLARCVYKEADIYLLDDPLSAVDTHVGRQLFDQCIVWFLKSKSVVLVTHQLQFLPKADCIYLLENGKITEKGTYDYVSKTNTDFTRLFQARDEENAIETAKPKPSALSLLVLAHPAAPLRERITSGKINRRVYLSYFKAGGWLTTKLLVVVLVLLAQVLASITDFYLGYWVNLEHKRQDGHDTTMSTNKGLDIYTWLILGLIIITLLRSFLFFKFCMNASKKLHRLMFSNAITAPMRFFDTNTSGRILNRFSSDIGIIDETLPSLALDSFQTCLLIVGILVIIAITNPWLLIATSIVITVFYCIRLFYLKTSRSLKRLEGIARSPIFAHLNASIQGLSTIRASEAQQVLIREFHKLQNFHTGVFYYCVVCSRGFGFWLDSICIMYSSTVIYSFFLLKSKEDAGNVGLAISQVLALTGLFQWGIRQLTELENQMTSVERVVEYTKIEPEESPNEIIPPSTWPERGNVDFCSVFLRYSPTDKFVLKNVNFSIQPKEKVGVVGRTGAGKSSLITALFQLTKTQGEIIIDGINISKVPLERLRSKIAIIPQEPVLFSGTIRKNLDPFDEHSNSDLWSALEEVELKAEIAKLPLNLYNLVSESGGNLSEGQRQLLCLARAIIRQNKILIMDEATANVDPQTDALIQMTVRKKFLDCSVITIAHRLNTIMDSDKVLVISFGEAMEYDHPYLLLKDKTSMFHSMVSKTGGAMAKILTAIAEQSYAEKNRSNASASPTSTEPNPPAATSAKATKKKN